MSTKIPNIMPEKNTYIWPQIELDATHYTLEQIHDAQLELPHIALAGRSNVGKSSLINALGKRKKLAKISSTPGKTRSVNFYKVIPDNFYLTDLPGYGYAQRSKTERELWATLIQKYLLHTNNLCAVVMLLDCRHSPQEVDIAMARFALDNRLPVFPILTKADKCTQQERALRQKEWEVFIPEIALPVSARDGMGLEELWKKLRFIASHYISENFDGEFNEFGGVLENNSDDQDFCKGELEDSQDDATQGNAEEKQKKLRWRSLKEKKPAKKTLAKKTSAKDKKKKK